MGPLDSTRPRARRRQRGQVLVLFLLVLVTMTLIGAMAVVVGQTLVRRQHAQMVVDAAAFAAASKQAEGLNTIAHWNEQALKFLQAIHISMAVPYVDNLQTSWSRAVQFIPGLLWYDWARPVLKDYAKVFDLIDSIINGANLYYSIANVATGPLAAARQVVNENFGGSSTGDRLFRGESPSGQEYLPSSLSSPIRLVKLTDAKEYRVGGYLYAPHPTVASYMASCCCPCPPFIFDPLCCALRANYASAAAYYKTISPFTQPIKYKLGRYYENNQAEVRCGYLLEVKNTPAIFGKNFFTDVPPITVMAAAKPYGGYLGNNYTNLWYLPIHYTWQGSKSISPTYKAKLVPLTQAEKAYAWARYRKPGSIPWNLTAMH